MSYLGQAQAAFSTLATAAGTIVVAGGGISIIVYGLFRYLGERWLTAKFDERLQAYKHAQQKELEQLRFRINSLMDRTTKLHEREFDVVPEAWARLIDAHSSVKGFTSAFRSYPDVNRMTLPQLEEFLAGSPLTGTQREELRASHDKLEYYQKAIFWHHLDKCRSSCREFNVYLLKNGIFMPAEMKAKFTRLEELIWDALVEHEVNEEHNAIPRERTKQKLLAVDGKTLLKVLEQDVQERLWSVQQLVSD
ncbi:hypothetical protein [Microvirga antarctica]|uniref:hypothetical protein n=1 Tax=Microvirga antarctica TaxID=2819233 RepID=UPI001B313BD7|nr:hypothetical protein [Microvirga antarctica]